MVVRRKHMEKGQYGYMNRHKRNLLISIISLGLLVITGVFITVVMFGTKKSVFIVIPILIALPFAKQIIAYLMCAGFKELTGDEYKRLEMELSYFGDACVLYDVSISRYEGMTYFPAAVIRDGRILVFYRPVWSKKLPDEKALKKVIQTAFEDRKKQYVVVVTTDLSDFIERANRIKAPGGELAAVDAQYRERLFELGV